MAPANPKVHVIRVPAKLDRQLRAHVRREGSSLVAVWRQALTEYLDRRENGHG